MSFEGWMAAAGKSPVEVAYEACVSVSSVYRARAGKPVSFGVAGKLVAVAQGAVTLESLLRGATDGGARRVG